MSICERAIQWATKELRATAAVTSLLPSPADVSTGDTDSLPSRPGVYVSAEKYMYREQHSDVTTVRVDIGFKGRRTDCESIAHAVRVALHQPPTNRKTWSVQPSSVGLRVKACRYAEGAPAGKAEAGKDFFVASLWFRITGSVA